MNNKYIKIKPHHGEGNPNKIKVLLYHHILDDQHLSNEYGKMCTDVKEFRRHLGLLERWGFTSITFEDYRLFKEGELNLPKKPVILTFDDGYTDIYKNAFPLLQEFGMKAVIFVVGDRRIRASIWDLAQGTPASLLNDEQLLEMHAAGFEIGSHTLTHVNLTSLPREQAWEEISRSRMLLEILLNSPVRSFAFPYGLSNSTTKKMLEDAGYTVGCSTYSGPPKFGKDMFEIRRILVPGATNTIRFAKRMLTPYEYYAWLRWKTKKIFFIGSLNGEMNRQEISLRQARKFDSVDTKK